MMRKTPLLCLLVLLAAPVSGVDVHYPPPSSVPTVPVDLIDDAGQSIDWRVEVPGLRVENGCLPEPPEEGEDTFDARTATVSMTKGAEVRTLALQRNVETREVEENDEKVIKRTVVFSGSLSVDDPDLTTGDWVLGLTVRDAQGNSYDCGDDRELTVTAQGDDKPPVVEFPSAVGGVVNLGSQQSLAPKVVDATLGRVEYRVDQMPKDTFFALKEPFVIPSRSFFPGENELIVRATDRAGHATTEAKVTVVVDGEDPELVVDLLNRTTFYAGIENPVILNVTDESDYRVTISFQGRDLVREGSGGESEEFRVGVPANHTGEDLLHVRVVDAFGNRVTYTRLLSVTQLATDARIEEVKQDPQRVVVGEDATVHVTVAQPEGVADVTFDLRLDGELLGNLTVPSRGDNETSLKVRLPPGRQELLVQAVAPDGVLHDAKNLTASVRVEVFLARVLVGDEAYHVRATGQGLPDGVVAPDGTVLATELVELGARSVYAFQVDNETYHYDPTLPTVQEFQDPEDVAGGGEDAPGPGVLLLLGALVALAAVRRRTR